MTTIPENLAEIGNKASTVATQYVELDAAKSELKNAETALLEAVVAQIRPSLHRIAAQRILESCTTASGGDDAEPEVSYFARIRALKVVDGYDESDNLDLGCANYVGYCLWLLSDGSFAETSRCGYRDDEGAHDEWTATLRPMTPTEVADEYDVPGCISAIVATIDRTLARDIPTRAKGLRTLADQHRSYIASLPA